MFSENDYWVPQYRYQLLEWFSKNYNKDLKGNVINWNKHPTKILFAIYHDKRKNENANATSTKSVGLRKEPIKDSPIPSDATRKISSCHQVVQGSKAQIHFDFST